MDKCSILLFFKLCEVGKLAETLWLGLVGSISTMLIPRVES